MSASASPNITKYFKTQRKRPRTGKEELVTSTKKIILEEGVISQPESVIVEDNCPKPTKAALVDIPAPVAIRAADRIKTDLERLAALKAKNPSKLLSISKKAKTILLEEHSGSSRADNNEKKDAPALEKQAGSSRADEKGKKAAPGYQRLHSLAQKTPAERVAKAGKTEVNAEADLILPFHFKVLKELFVACETVIGIMKNRKEITIYPKVKAAVMELVRRVPLREKHLAQMVSVLPGCYTFELEKVGQDTHIKINVEDVLPSVILARRKAFHSALIKRCLEHHQKFLSELVPPIRVPADKQISRWHPQFKLDEIPDIVAAENALPAKPPPVKVSTALEVIAKAKSILEHANPRMRQAVISIVNNASKEPPQAVSSVAAQPKASAKLKALKGVSKSLLEKIQKREQEKLLKEMTRSPADSTKLQMLKRLPNFIRIIRNMMVAEKKVSLPMDTVIERICHSIQNMSAGDTEAHLRLLPTVGSGQGTLKISHWLKIVKLFHSDVEYVRIDKNIDINDLLEEMNEIIKKHSSM